MKTRASSSGSSRSAPLRNVSEGQFTRRLKSQVPSSSSERSSRLRVLICPLRFAHRSSCFARRFCNRFRRTGDTSIPLEPRHRNPVRERALTRQLEDGIPKRLAPLRYPELSEVPPCLPLWIRRISPKLV